MSGAEQQANKPTNRLIDTETDKNLCKKNKKNKKIKILKEEKHILTNRRTSRLTVDTCTERVRQKMKNEAPCSVVIEINKE